MDKNIQKGAQGLNDTSRFVIAFTFHAIRCAMQNMISKCLTFRNELYDENHRSAHEKRGSLTESPTAVSEQQHGYNESWHLHHCRQEEIQVQVAMKVCGV